MDAIDEARTSGTGSGATQLAGVWPVGPCRFFRLISQRGDGTRYDGSHYDGESCRAYRDLGCICESHRLSFLGPRRGGAGPADERNAADQQTIERMCASDRGHQDAYDVLNDKEDDRGGAQNDERSSALLQFREFGGQSDRREEKKQEEIREPAGKLNRYVDELMEQGRRGRDQQPADHGDGHIETSKQMNASGDGGRNHQREQTHGEGLKLG